jgi:BirA family biotin operon repressor/biotin-[acetyl-CoA-carboxylase] ligase
LNLLLLHIEQRYLQLRNGNKQSLKADYLNCLHGRNENRSFSDAEGVFEGIITDVTEEGKLLISKAGELKSYSLKEVIFL